MRRRGSRARRWLAVVFALGVAVFLPAITSPLVLDDYLHVSMVRGTFPAKRTLFDLYDFVSDDNRARMFDKGLLPWWTHPHFTIRFFRPLSSALLWVNHRLFDGHPFLLHLHPLAWWVACVFAARALFRRLLPERAGLLATAIFALGVWHAMPIAWLANNEALVSLACGTLALGAYEAFRREGRAAQAALAGALFGLALLAGEYTLCFGGYVLAIEVTRREGLGRRARGVLPFAIPVAAYLGVRGALHYGALASGFYFDPLREPGAFLESAPWRIVALLFDGWVTVKADTWSPGLVRWAAGAGVLAMGAALVVPIRRALAELEEGQRKAATWLALGSLFALPPVLSVVPSARLLGVSALGIASTVAIVVDCAWFGAKKNERSRAAELTSMAALLLGFAHLVHGPVTALLTGWAVRQTAVDFVAHTDWLRDTIVDPDRTEVVVVRAGGGMFFGPFAVDARGRFPARWRTLSYTGHALVLRRGPRTLDIVTAPDQSIYPGGAGNLFRSPSAPMHAGDVVRLPGMVVTVLQTGPAGPTRARFVFDHDLDAPDMVWAAESSSGFVSAEPPGIGLGKPFDP